MSEFTERRRALDQFIEGAQKWVTMGFDTILLHGIVTDEIFGSECTCPKGPLCRSAGKHPLMAGWQSDNIYWRPPTKEVWRHQKSDSNLGVRMGCHPKGAEWIAIDVDGDKGAESMRKLVAAYGALPATLTQRTGSGGQHLIFAWAGDADDSRTWKLPTTSSGKIGPGVDIRGEGGLIVAAPSMHVSGRRYEITNDVPPAILPSTWYAMIGSTHGCAK